ncbi:MAG: NUDIX hydrolase [Clostridia bacterium]|nr:NUDIX hydrolase [Clostridia bacterium]
MNYEEKTLSRKLVYKGGIIDVESQTVLLPDGREASRDVVLHPGASVVIPISEAGELYMVRQYRKPIGKTTLEIPAGKLDAGEDPLVCAQRELKEETGLEAKNIKHLISVHSTPGFSNEVLHMYAATELQEGEACSDEDEFISSEKIKISELIDMVLNHEITDAKTVIGVLLADKIVKGEI